MSLTAAQRKKVSSGRITDAANVMTDQTLHLIKCILIKHETAQLEVMAEMKVRINELEQQRDELQARAHHYETENGKQAEMLNEVIRRREGRECTSARH